MMVLLWVSRSMIAAAIYLTVRFLALTCFFMFWTCVHVVERRWSLSAGLGRLRPCVER